MLYSKNGSIPAKRKDGNEGWIEVEDPPIAPEGKEVVWWYPPGWVVRDIKPQDTPTTSWAWSQALEQWVEYEIYVPTTTDVPIIIEEEPAIVGETITQDLEVPVSEQPQL